MKIVKRLARYVLRHEIARARQEALQWKQSALIQERYRQEVHGETPAHEGWRAWFFKTYPRNSDLPRPRWMSPLLDEDPHG